MFIHGLPSVPFFLRRQVLLSPNLCKYHYIRLDKSFQEFAETLVTYGEKITFLLDAEVEDL